MSVDDKVIQNTARIISLEGGVNQLKVETSNLSLKFDYQEDKQKERFDTLCTSQIELKDIMKARQEADERRAEEARRYRAEREQQEATAQLQKQKWVQSLLTPQTFVIILVILAGLFGVKGIDMMSAAEVVQGTSPPPTGTIP